MPIKHLEYTKKQPLGLETLPKTTTKLPKTTKEPPKNRQEYYLEINFKQV